MEDQATERVIQKFNFGLESDKNSHKPFVDDGQEIFVDFVGRPSRNSVLTDIFTEGAELKKKTKGNSIRLPSFSVKRETKPVSEAEFSSMYKIRIGNLPEETTEKTLRNIMERICPSLYGNIRRVIMLKEKDTGRFRGITLVIFSDKDSAEYFAKKINGTKFGFQIVSASVSIDGQFGF